MLYIDRIDVSEGIMLIRQVNQKSVIFVTIGIFLHKGFKFQPHVMSKNLCDIAILNIHGTEYSCIISRISKSEAIKLMQNIDLTEKNRTLQKIKIYNDT